MFQTVFNNFNAKRKGEAQNSASSKSAFGTLDKDKVFAEFDAKRESRQRERQLIEIASRDKQAPTYESYIPEEYKGKYEDYEEGWYGFDTVAAELKHNYGITPDKLEYMTDEEKKLVTYLYTQDEPSPFEKIFSNFV